jgi:hypothetical protein
MKNFVHDLRTCPKEILIIFWVPAKSWASMAQASSQLFYNVQSNSLLTNTRD